VTGESGLYQEWIGSRKQLEAILEKMQDIAAEAAELLQPKLNLPLALAAQVVNQPHPFPHSTSLVFPGEVAKLLILLVGRRGLEPRTFGLKVRPRTMAPSKVLGEAP
jgi:hypothetical protein